MKKPDAPSPVPVLQAPRLAAHDETGADTGHEHHAQPERILHSATLGDRIEGTAHWLFPRLLLLLTLASFVPPILALSTSVGALEEGRVTLMPPCPVRGRTGADCPGCGLTRSVVASVHGDLSQAWRYHRVGPAVALGLLLAPAALSWLTARRWSRRTMRQAS